MEYKKAVTDVIQQAINMIMIDEGLHHEKLVTTNKGQVYLRFGYDLSDKERSNIIKALQNNDWNKFKIVEPVGTGFPSNRFDKILVSKDLVDPNRGECKNNPGYVDVGLVMMKKQEKQEVA